MSRGDRRSSAAVLAIVGCAGLAFVDPTVSADLDEILARGTLRVLTVPSDGPDEFFSTIPGTEPGFDREVLEGFARLHKLTVQVVPVTTWSGLVPALRDGKGDLVAGRFTVTEGRRKLVDFTVEVFPTRDTVVTRRPHPPITTLQELRVERVGTVKGTSLAEAAAAAGIPASNLDDSIPSGSLPEALKQGKVGAVILGVENAITARRADPELELGLFLGKPGSLAFAVRPGDAKLLGAVNSYLENLRRTPTWSRLVVKYFGQDSVEILRKARVE